MRKIFPALAISLVLALVATTLAVQSGAKGKPVTDVPVTVTIDGLGVDTVPTLRVQSDLLGAYVNSVSGESILQNGAAWELDMLNFNSSPQRKVLIDLRDPVPNSAPGGANPFNPFGATGYGVVRARFLANPTGTAFKDMQMGTPYFVIMVLSFDDATGQRYRIAQNPINFSQTNYVQVSCLGADGSAKCNQWKIEPSVIGGPNRGKLIKVPSRPNRPEEDMGDFNLSFSINLTRP